MTTQPVTRYTRGDTTSYSVVSASGSVGVASNVFHDVFWVYRPGPVLVASPTFMVPPDRILLTIATIGGRPLSKVIPVAIECVNDSEFLATAPELNIGMPGETAGEAFVSLRDYIADVYEELSISNNLGPDLSRQLQQLEEHFGRQGRKQAKSKRRQKNRRQA